MTVSANPDTGAAVRPGFFGAWREPARRELTVDVFAVLLAASLPWSTSVAGIFVVLWLAAVIPTLYWRAFFHSLKRPAAALPLAFFALAVVGVLWSDSPWPARLHGVNPVGKLLVIPFLLYHFERSRRSAWVLIAFAVSCTLLLALSWVVLFAPWLKLTSTPSAGVPVGNYIDQSQEFSFCMFALAPFVVTWLGRRRVVWAATAAVLILAYFANMMFVVSARTALVYIPLLLISFAMFHLSGRKMALVLAGALVAATLVWLTSPYLRERVRDVVVEYQGYRDANTRTSTGERLEFWRKSFKFISGSPLIGNGTGSTQQLFERDAVGQSGVSAEVIGNPHNQTLNVAVQWGFLGLVILYAMWMFHLLLFRGTGIAAWIGLLVVLQNFLSSMFNSHLFDFHEGWMYVLGVGVAGGAMLRHAREQADAEGRVLSSDTTKLSGVWRQ